MEYSNNLDDCTDNREIISDEEFDFSGLDELSYDLTHMNGRATLSPPVRDEAAELAAFELSMRPLDEIASEPDPGAAIRADAYAAQDRAIQATVTHVRAWQEKQAARRGKANEARAAARDAAREEKSAKLAEARRLRHVERERNRRKLLREAKAAIPPPMIGATDAGAIKTEAKRLHDILCAATNDPASPERVRRLRGEETELTLWFAAYRVAALRLDRARASVPSRKTGPSLEAIARERTTPARGSFTRYAARHALGKIRLLIDAGIWPAL